MGHLCEELASADSIPENERWVHESELQYRLESAREWMVDYIAKYPDQIEHRRVILYMGFQCSIYELEGSDINAIANSLKVVFAGDWDALLNNSALECQELVSLPGYFKVRLSNAHLAVVGREGRGIFFLALHREKLPDADTEEWIAPVGTPVSSYSLEHNHSTAPRSTDKERKIWRETCPRCRAFEREQTDLHRLATPIYVEMLSSSPFYQARGTEPDAWWNFIESGIVGAQKLVAQRCGVFIPLGCHEKPDKRMRKYLNDWQLAHPNESPDQSKG